MGRKKEMFLVVDTETANGLDQPLPYDIGYAVCDRHGNIELMRSFVVAEIFIDNKDLMQSAYYSDKIPQYWKDIKEGKRILTSFYNIRRQIKEDMEKYNISKVGAYNMGFDKRALNNNTRYITKSFLRWFFPYGTQYFCIWNMACDTILNRPTYIKFALENGFVSEKNNIQTSAECAYRYITKDVDFVECHTGLEDVIIEVAIMAYCYRQHKKFDNSINSACWRKVQKVRVA
jgi:hypothetical protein